MSQHVEELCIPFAKYPPEMSNYLLQPAVSSSGHVNNWTSLPGFIVGYQDLSSTIIPVAYPLGNQCIEKSFCGYFVSTATKTSATPMNSANCDVVQDITNQTPPVSTYANNWRVGRKRCRKRKRQDKDAEFPAVPANFGDNSIARYENISQVAPRTDHVISDKFSVELDASREERNYSGALEESRYCRVCRATFNAPAQAKQHYSGRLHKRMVRLFSDDYSPSSMMMQHRASVTCPAASGGSGNRISASVYCALCSVAFNSDKQAVQHYAGKTHAKRLRADDVIYTYTKNGYVTRRCQEKPKLRQTRGQRLLPAEGFVCVVCGAQMTSQCRMRRHLRNRHRLCSIPLEFTSIY